MGPRKEIDSLRYSGMILREDLGSYLEMVWVKIMMGTEKG